MTTASRHGLASSMRIRARYAALISALTASALCWWLLSRASGWHAMSHPHAEVTASTWVVAVLMWQLMMTAMMLPVVAPWLGLVAVTHADQHRRPAVAVGLFAGGYLGAWLAYSTVAATLQVALQTLSWSGETLLLPHGVASGILILAGAFQFTPLKRACLRHCRSPISYVIGEWRDQPPGAFRMGFGHGLFCVGCCWALMLVALVLGVMNLAWMTVLTLVAAAEQIAPGGRRVADLVGVAFIAWGLWIAIA